MAKGEKMKHKHCELIKAWADGAEIQRLIDDIWWDSPEPDWYPEYTYRIKPSVCQNTTNLEEKNPVVRWLWARKGGLSYCLNSMIFATEEEAAMNPLQMFKLEWSRTEFPE
jgi:hypothetical protein